MTYDVKENLCAGQEEFVGLLESLIKKFDVPPMLVTCGEDSERGLPEYRITRVSDFRIIATITPVKNTKWSWQTKTFAMADYKKCDGPDQVFQLVGEALARLVVEDIR